ncbi:MAG: WD40 repeat domain-containing protein [Anaerolineae bacterium]|nr:WD40 repeat domain-containing protein [Anaerolineae bacterium]
MRRVFILSTVLVLLLAASLALAQNTPAPQKSFEVVTELGRALPRNIVYEPKFEHIVMVDAYNRLVMVNALNFQTLYTLHDSGSYNDLAFSHDGRWFALAINNDIELFDTATGKLASQITDPGAAIDIHGPLTFSADDKLLTFYGTHPAPQALRRYENDTTETPWIWDLAAARNEGRSTFPGKVEAWQFFDYRFGFVLAPDSRIVAALPGRLNILDAYTLDVLFEIPTDRYEQDPLFLWFSVLDGKVYVYTRTGKLLQVDTQRGLLAELPLHMCLQDTFVNSDGTTSGTPSGCLSQRNPADVPGLEMSPLATEIGAPSTTSENALLRALLGDRYSQQWNNRPLTITLMDFVYDPTGNDTSGLQALVYMYDEKYKAGIFKLTNAYRIQQMVLNKEHDQVMLRRNTDSGGERVEFYNLSKGQLLGNITPATRDIGAYSFLHKNRILAYDNTGSIIISDFQRFDAATYKVLTEDLRYSTRFDQFFFSPDNKNVVTLAGNEWRLWDVDSGQVIRREVLALRGSVIATAASGYRFLTQFNTNDSTGVEVLDVNSGEKRSMTFQSLPGRGIDQIIPSPDWEHFLIIYATNTFGPYAPGNEIALYSLKDGQLWFMVGDDLPPPDGRYYGWADPQTAYIYGEGSTNEIPKRVFGSNFAPSGVPACLVDAFPDKHDLLSEAWYNGTLHLRVDEVEQLGQVLCAKLSQSGNSTTLPAISADLVRLTVTPVVIAGIPECITQHYAEQAASYADDWQKMIAGLNPEQIMEMEQIVCESLPTPSKSTYVDNGVYTQQTIMIDVKSCERLNGSYNPPANPVPLDPIRDEYYRTTQHELGTFILSPDQKLVAASSLPGELVIFRLMTPYKTMLSWGTATAAAKYDAENRIAVLPTTTPTYSPIGTAQPTLTPTVTPTPPPRPEEKVHESVADQSEQICPTSVLYSLDALPEGYSPTGRIVVPIQGGSLWTIQPENGKRISDEKLPVCGGNLNQCTFSPDNQWILINGINEVFVVRPDGSDARVLFDKSKPPYKYRIPDLSWSGANTLEYKDYGPIPDDPDGRYGYLYFRDILGVFPDPKPWAPEKMIIRQQPGQLLSRQPGGQLTLAELTFSTGVNTGYQYYLYNTETKDASYFARLADYPEQQLTAFWHPLGDRLFYHYPVPTGVKPVWYQYQPATNEHRLLGDLIGGVWSTDGRYTAYSTNQRSQHIGVWDSQTGLNRTYCIPELVGRVYNGQFHWSPDSRYLALQAQLAKDENIAGVGQHTLVLDIATGAVVDVMTGAGDIVVWMRNPGSYGTGG